MNQCNRTYYFTIIILLCLIVGCNYTPASSVQSTSAINTVFETTTQLSTIPDKLDKDMPLEQQPTYSWSDLGRGVATVMHSGETYSVIHNNNRGKPYSDVIEHLKVSRSGKHVAFSINANGKRRMVRDGQEGMFFDDVWEPIFSPDEHHIAYIAQLGEKIHLVIDNSYNYSATGSSHGSPVFSADSTKVAYIESTGTGKDLKTRIVICNLATHPEHIKESSGSIMVVNDARTKIAAVEEVNKQQRVIEFSFAQPDVVKHGELYERIELLVFGKDGSTVAYVAKKGSTNYLVMGDKVERLPNAQLVEQPVIRPDLKKVGMLLAEKDHCFLKEFFSTHTVSEHLYDEVADLVYSNDSKSYAYTARSGNKRFVVLNGKEGPTYDKIVSPKFTPDGDKLVIRARRDGKRFVAVLDRNAVLVNEHPAYEQVFGVTFTADGKSVAYGVKDGNKLMWVVEKL